MRLYPALRTAVLIAVVCLSLQGQATPGKDVPMAAKGMPARATPADYQAQAQAGGVTIAADFEGHSIPGMEGTLSTEDYAVIEVAVFGPAGARLKLSIDDFTLRINGKKTPLPSQPFGLAIKSVRDPEWLPPEAAESKSKSSSLSSGGDEGQQTAGPKPTPTPVRIPFEIQRAWSQRAQKAALPEGDRTLPVAGLIFFQFHGKTQGIRSMELIYAGPAGKATLALLP